MQPASADDIAAIKWNRTIERINKDRERSLFWRLFAMSVVGFGATMLLLGWAINSILIYMYG